MGQGALPEIVDDECGLIVEAARLLADLAALGLLTGEMIPNCCSGPFRGDRIDIASLEKLLNVISSPGVYHAMALNGYDRGKGPFYANDASKYWDRTYKDLCEN